MIHDWARSSIRDFDIGWLRARQGNRSVYVYGVQIILIVLSPSMRLSIATHGRLGTDNRGARPGC